MWVLFLCKIFVHRSVFWGKLLGVSLLATLVQCVVLLMGGNPYLKLILGFGGIMAGSVWLLFRPIGRKRYRKTLVCAYMAALLMGGSLLFLENLFSFPRLTFLNLMSTAALCGLSIWHLAGRFQEKKNQKFVQVRLFLSGKKQVQLLALIDTGNGLVEPISKSPVSLVEKKAVADIEDGFLPERFRLVPFHSIGQSGGLLDAYIIEGMEVEQEGEWKRIEGPVIGLTGGKISAKEKYQMILHPALLEN